MSRNIKALIVAAGLAMAGCAAVALQQSQVTPVAYVLTDPEITNRLSQLDDELLREYVVLVVDEIDALRTVRGDLCYDLIVGEEADGLARARKALPAALRAREDAFIARVLDAPRRRRVILSEEDAEEALGPINEILERKYGDDLDILDDDDLFAENKDLGCHMHRDLLALTLKMPVRDAAPIWRYMFSEEPADSSSPGSLRNA